MPDLQIIRNDATVRQFKLTKKTKQSKTNKHINYSKHKQQGKNKL